MPSTEPTADQVASGLAAQKYAQNLEVTQTNIDKVLNDIEALQREKKRLEEEQARLEFLEKLDAEQQKLEQELIALKSQYKEIETIKAAIKDKEFIQGQLVNPPTQVLCSTAGSTEGCVSAQGYSSTTQLSSGDGIGNDSDLFSGMSNVAIITLSVGFVLVLMICLVVFIYCCRRKNETKHHKDI